MSTIIGVVVLAIIALNPITAAVAQSAETAFTDDFPLESCHFAPWGGNDYFELDPGQQRHLSNAQCVAAGDCEALEEVWITVKREIRRIPAEIGDRTRTIWTRVVEELETEDGLLTEVSLNHYATCLGTGDVYYFGETVAHYEDGEIVGHDGSWTAGVAGARPGLIMPRPFLLGARYFQELAPPEALDRAEHVATGLDVSVPAGEYRDCVRVDETSSLEPGEISTKIYCPEAGLVVDEELELTALYE